MKPLFFIFISIILAVACTSQADKDGIAHAPTSLHLDIPHINVVATGLPLHLDKIDLNAPQNKVEISDGKIALIEKVVKDYYYDECDGDLNQTFIKVKDTYIGTLWAVDTLTSVFYVILRHPSGKLDAQIAFYDNVTNQPLSSTLRQNIHNMYHIDDGRFIPSELKKKLLQNTPEIEALDYNQDGINDFKISGLRYNNSSFTPDIKVYDVTSSQLNEIKPEKK